MAVRSFLPMLGVALLAAMVPALAAERTVMLAIEHMTCELCPPIVKRSLSRVPGVAKAEVSARQKTATVVFDDQKTTIQALISATTDAGYPSHLVTP